MHPTRTGADAVTGTWTGAAQVRGNYYWDRSTRVLAPEIIAQLDAPQGTRMRVDYLIDSITSASIAAGALEDTRFQEVRHDVADYYFEVQRWDGDVGKAVQLLREVGELENTIIVMTSNLGSDRIQDLAGRTVGITYGGNDETIMRAEADPTAPVSSRSA